MQQRSKMTNNAVEKFQCGVFESGAHKGEPKTQDTLWDGEVKGFGMRFSAKSRTRTYFFSYRVKGEKKETYVTIGRHNDPYRVDQARAKALELKAQMLGGVNPVAEAKRKHEDAERQTALDKAQSTTLRQVMESYLANKRTKHGPLRPATQQDMRRHCEKNLTSWLDEPVTTITRDKCLAKFTELTDRAPQQANSCMIYLRALLFYARELHATEDGQFPVLAVNPVTRLFKLKKPNPEKPSVTRIPLAKVGACWNHLQKQRAEARRVDDRTAADWLCFVMLTGCRRLESGSLKWSDVDLEAKTFTLRADVVKNHSALTLPMSRALYELLTSRSEAHDDSPAVRRRRSARSREYAFASNGRKSPFITNAQATVEALSKIAGTHVHLHAMRRTFDDIAQACRVDGDVRRMLLNHIHGDVHSRHYANGVESLAPAVESIAKWIVDAAHVADEIASGRNVIAFTG